MKLLSRSQQVMLITTATQAYAHQVEAGFIRPREDTAKTAQQTKWRHAETQKITGVGSLGSCVNEHFEHLMGHFLNLAGRESDAFGFFLRAGPLPGARPQAEATPALGEASGSQFASKGKAEIPDTLANRQTWRWKLKQLCAEMKKPFPQYVLGILKRQTGVERLLDDHAANALRKAFFSLNYSAGRGARSPKAKPPKATKLDLNNPSTIADALGDIDVPF